MKILKSDFVKALEAVKPGLARKETIEQSTSFAFIKNRICTFNDEISISIPIPDLDITGAVSADLLYKFITKAPGEEISFEVEENKLKIRSGKARVTLSFIPEVLLPLSELGEIKTWKEIPKDLLAAISFSEFCVSSYDPDHLDLMTINFKKDGTVETCDNYRGVQYSLEKELPIKPFRIMGDSAKILTNYPISKITVTPGWVHFKAQNGLIFSCRLFQDNYVNLDTLFEFEEGEEFVFPEKIEETLYRASLFKNLEWGVEISLEGNRLYVRTQSEGAEFEEWIPISAEERKKKLTFSFYMLPQHLRDILRHTSVGLVSSSKILFSGENWRNVILFVEPS